MLGVIIVKTAPQKYDQFDENIFIMTFKVYFVVLFLYFFSTFFFHNHFIFRWNNNTHKTNNNSFLTIWEWSVSRCNAQILMQTHNLIC